MLQFADYTPISPLQEIVAYETLWAKKGASFKTIADLFAKNPGSRPSDFIDKNENLELLNIIKDFIINSNKDFRSNFLINGTYDFPSNLKDAKEPVELLYYTGILGFLNTRCVAIVGTRHPSERGLQTTKTIAQKLVKDDFTVVSGLATGIDTQAHNAAISANGRTIGVLGTPLNTVYPKQNKELQNIIAKNHLLISQVPFYKYSNQNYKLNRFFFLERNKTMSALTKATIIVEAGETSGSLTQAKAAIHQGRKLLICEACFQNKEITWPQKFEKLGAKRVSTYSDIRNELNV